MDAMKDAQTGISLRFIRAWSMEHELPTRDDAERLREFLKRRLRMQSDYHQLQMPEYQCHKKVRAAKILAIAEARGTTLTTDTGDAYVRFTHRITLDVEYPLELATQWVERYKPVVGGYYVEYEDGYTSFSPAAAFESGYTKIGA